ncbi:hypothetical protein [Paenibacillus wulumuqiensis]|uniref:hypothetical protein n=1 Tax=Paenibacillus wulumuqiensis TaxID=1567107 RepID=UPI0006194201|nr:hypothetical protein [Paenibacillus wulumuqiensis]
MAVLPIVDSKTGMWIRQIETNSETLRDGETIVYIPSSGGFYENKWDFESKQWVEGLSAEEIEKIKNSMPATEATETVEKKLARLEQADLDNKELIASLYEMLLSREK